MTNSELKVLAAKVTSQHKTFKRGISNQTVEEVVSALLLSASQADKIAELEKERDEYHAMVVYMGAIMDESEGVAGYHLNGDIAKWDDLFTTSILEDAASIRDLEQQAKALSDAHKVIVENKMLRSARDYIDFRAAELLEMSKALKEGK
jgi:hypothetical protein